jgi:hypothetical protein
LRFRIKPWLTLSAIALLVAVIAYLVRFEQRRFVRTSAEMVAILPHRDLTTVFLNVDVLRRAKLLGLLHTSKAEQDHDYEQFVRETGFDYARDIDVLVARGNEQQIFFVIRGNFDWRRLRDYARRHDGSCDTSFCKAPTGRPGRWASYLSIQPDVIGLSVSGDPADVLLLSPRRIDNAPAIPTQPVWVSVAHSLLADPKGLPLPLRLFATAVQAADSVTLLIGSAGRASNDFELRMQALCRNAAAADTVRSQLEIDTKMLKIELEREHRRPSRGDLSGLLTSGTFWLSGNKVIGNWPIHQELLQTLQ